MKGKVCLWVNLDYYIDALRDNIANKYSKLKGEKISNEEIFLMGYSDKPGLLKISFFFIEVKDDILRLNFI